MKSAAHARAFVCFEPMSDPIFQLTQAVYEKIVSHAREGKPQEVCGILRGQGRCAFEAVRAHNLAPDPIHDYEVDPQTLLLQFEFEPAGDEMVAIYHSHPVSPAYPSASDAWSAHYPDCTYLICSLQDDTVPVVRAFRLLPHDVSLDLPTLRASLDFDETRPGRFAYYQSAQTAPPPILQPVAASVPAPFYIVFEVDPETGQRLPPRVVSLSEEHIQILSRCA